MSLAPAKPSTFAFGARLYLRGLAVVHAVALVSFWSQWRGLIGPHGLLPAARFFIAVREQLGASAYLQLPSLCWIFGAENALPILCAGGLALSAALFVGLAPALCLAGLWLIYLSLLAAGQVFYGFQWDSLLLEATLLAIPLAPWTFFPGWKLAEPPRLARLLLWWLLARLMFLSGVVKLFSGDPSWRDLTALTFHFETQPLPTPLAWYVHQLPDPVLRACCAALFAIELAAPLCLFGPRRLRHHAALWLLALQVVIALTGNYAFFNWLTLLLCLQCFDDRAWARSRRRSPPAPVLIRCIPAIPLRIFAAVVLTVTVLGAGRSLGMPSPRPLNAVFEAVAPFESLNNYGLFAVMTHPRPELIFEGSNDDRTWLPYEFPHKPGDLSRAPDFVAPFQPRLDWQLWFAALEEPESNPWVNSLCGHLLRGTPAVLALLKTNPFPQKPPKYLRVVRYTYHFTTRAEHARTGQWWKRTQTDLFVPVVTLNDP